MADLQSAALAAGLLPRIIIKLDSYPLEESVSSGALINLPQMVTIFTNHQRLQAALSFCLVTLSFSATRYLESTFFVTIHLSEGFMPFTNKYSLCTLGCRLLYFLNGQNVTEATGATSVCQLIPINRFELLTFPV